MKRLIALLLALVMVFALAACGGKTDETPDANTETPDANTETPDANTDTPDDGGEDSEAPADSDILVAGIVFQDDQFMNMLTQGYVDAANDAGVEILTDNTNNDQAKETELINTYLAQGVDGLATPR